jgi:scyllo-inositol 2-dehydrogenase (NADP+)
MAAEIGVGIIGFGLAGKVFHAPFVSAVPGLKLQAFVERRTDEAHAAYPHTRTVRTVEELLADPAIQLVVVATPNPTHFALAKQALAAGKHVVIDKPFAASSAEARELIALAAEHNVLVAPFHNRRFDGDFLTLKKLLADGVLGRLVTFESHFDRYRPIQREGTWKEAGDNANGLLFDLGPHLVDQAVALFGMPSTLTASVRSDRDSTAIEDAFDICLGYRVDGHDLRVWCRSSMLACDNAPRFLLHGTAGSFKKSGLDPQEPALVSGAKVPQLGSAANWLQESEPHWGTLTIATNLNDPNTVVKSPVQTLLGDYRLFYANVRDAIRGEAPLAIPSAAGEQVIRLLELARVSSTEARTLTL